MMDPVIGFLESNGPSLSSEVAQHLMDAHGLSPA